MNKPALREYFLAKRSAIDEETFKENNEKIKYQFLAEFQNLKINAVHTFLPIAHRKEIDTMPILEELKRMLPEINIVVSKSNMKILEMTSYLLKANTVLEINRWGIPEPVDAELFDDQKLDMVLIPLLAFDKSGHRVGYGKGFYDRFLKRCRPETIKVGLCFEPPVSFIPDTHDYDVTLDYCVTPDRVHSFT